MSSYPGVGFKKICMNNLNLNKMHRPSLSLTAASLTSSYLGVFVRRFTRAAIRPESMNSKEVGLISFNKASLTLFKGSYKSCLIFVIESYILWAF
jgi:hypothetical protein